ncbi:hypothetical protein ACT8ZV_04430 [Nocardioides sp. MAHUQ-72]|uniref:hypothetical protein n=1 Tax=unclassified Nocardioides TaxID=2615069 RepID=UPI0036191485
MCAHLDRLDPEEMRELVTDAWRMCTPAMLHDLPELPAPTAAAWAAMDAGEWDGLRTLLHPDVEWSDGPLRLRGRARVLEHLRSGSDAAAARAGGGPRRAGAPLGALTTSRN